MEGLVHKDTGVRETRYVHSLSSRVFLEGKVGAQTSRSTEKNHILEFWNSFGCEGSVL